MVVGELDRHAAAERVAEDERGSSTPTAPRKLVHPGGVALDGALARGRSAVPPNPGIAGAYDPASVGDQPAQRPPVGAVAEAPAVEEHHRQPLAADPVERPAAVDVQLVPREVVEGAAHGSADAHREQGRPDGLRRLAQRAGQREGAELERGPTTHRATLESAAPGCVNGL